MKCLAVLLERKEIVHNIFVYKYVDVISEAEKSNKYNMIQTKINGEERNIPIFTDKEANLENYTLFYGYFVPESDLNPSFDKESYVKNIKKNINLGFYDEEKQDYKIVFTDREKLLKLKYSNVENIEVNKEDFKFLLDCLEEKDYDMATDMAHEIEKSCGTSQLDLNTETTKPTIKTTPKEPAKKSNIETLEDLEEVLSPLNSLVGLEEVKEKMRKLGNLLLYYKKVDGRTKLPDPIVNFFFTGNPGTGKTTVARIVAKLLYQMNYAKNDKFAEVTASSLVAGYVGQTAIKTKNLIEKNRGGVIFVDEAYVLAEPAQEFGQDSIAEIVDEMSSKQTIFIMAGYEERMINLINSNPGFPSRVEIINFKDYSEEELFQIFINQINSSLLKIGSDSYELISKIIKEAKKVENFGNGRFIDRLYNEMLQNQADNTVRNDKHNDELTTITKQDFDGIEVKKLVLKKEEKRQIGFIQNNQ